jgi:hypothetical protein
VAEKNVEPEELDITPVAEGVTGHDDVVKNEEPVAETDKEVMKEEPSVVTPVVNNEETGDNEEEEEAKTTEVQSKTADFVIQQGEYISREERRKYRSPFNQNITYPYVTVSEEISLKLPNPPRNVTSLSGITPSLTIPKPQESFDQIQITEYDDPSIIKSNMKFRTGDQSYEPNPEHIIISPSVYGSKDEESEAYLQVLNAMQNSPGLSLPESLQ